MNYAHPEFLISTKELDEQLSDPRLVILDLTTTLIPDGKKDGGFVLQSGEATFLEGHIPGARYVHLEKDFSRPEEGLLFTLPSIEKFAQAAERFGISADSFVVVYSTAQPGWAARFWLMLKAFGFDNAAVLDGGFTAWKAEGYEIETGAAKSPSPVATPFNWQDHTKNYFVATDTIESVVSGHKDAKLINALPVDVFNGTGAIAYGRRGHIPGSLNLPTGSVVGSDGHYLEAENLAALFASNTIAPDDDVITYCGAGVAASNVAFARFLLGHEKSRVYDGSMMEWTKDPQRQVVR